MGTQKMTSANESAGSPARLLIIDDDRKLCRLITDYLAPLGYEVHAAHTGPEGADRATSEAWQAIILDFMLPGCDGLEVLKRIRAKTNVPVLMLTARGEEADRIVGLEIGADDYLPKTFSTRELLARLRAVTRRAQEHIVSSDTKIEPEITVGTLRINPNNRTVLSSGQLLTFTPVEFDILYCLARAKGRIKSRDSLLDEIRDRNYEVFDRSIDVHVSAIRRKIGDDAKEPRYIRTVRAAGYMMMDPEA
jgi:two-component system response regulator CpxR